MIAPDLAGFLLGVYDQIEAFVLADIAAKRAAVGLHKVRGRNILGQPVCASCSPLTPVPCSTLLALAQPYRGWPGWRDEWETGR